METMRVGLALPVAGAAVGGALPRAVSSQLFQPVLALEGSVGLSAVCCSVEVPP